jgi:dethiobiotin synthetase
VPTGFFITGTDTEIGKTTATVALMRALKQQGYEVAGMKPVAAGCRLTAQGLHNDDALILKQEATVNVAYELVNPFAYQPPIAPHIAAAQVRRPITIEPIVAAYQQIASQAEVVVVEGIGGWAVPISDRQTMADVARALDLPIILVVGIRLGCLNHALLTYENIIHKTCTAGGWIANMLGEDNPVAAQNIDYLKQALPVPYLGTLAYLPGNEPHQPTALNLTPLLEG